MENFETKPLSTVRVLIEENVFNTDINEHFFLPARLYEYALNQGCQTEIYDILNWEAFEDAIDNDDMDELYFKEKILHASENISENIYIITDETIKLGISYRIGIMEFDDFVRYYERKFEMAFLQPADYIIVFENIWKILAIHHDGKLILIYPQK